MLAVVAVISVDVHPFFVFSGVLSKGCKPDNFESQNCLKLGFTNI